MSKGCDTCDNTGLQGDQLCPTCKGSPFGEDAKAPKQESKQEVKPTEKPDEAKPEATGGTVSTAGTATHPEPSPAEAKTNHSQVSGSKKGK